MLSIMQVSLAIGTVTEKLKYVLESRKYVENLIYSYQYQ